LTVGARRAFLPEGPLDRAPGEKSELKESAKVEAEEEEQVSVPGFLEVEPGSVSEVE